MKKIILLVFVLIALMSCKTQNYFVQKNNESQTINDSFFCYKLNYQYTIKKDDKLSISVWGQDELSIGSVYGIYNSNEVYGKWLLVDIDGNIEIPKIGTTNVIGKTIPQLKDTLKKLYKKWIQNPIVDVKVLNKEITILGELKNPGVIKIDKDQNTLLEMISKAGGTEQYANLKKIKVLRQDGVNVRVVNINLTKYDNYLNRNISLHAGDIVIVPSKKYKEFDKRIGTVVPFTTIISAAAIMLKFL